MHRGAPARAVDGTNLDTSTKRHVATTRWATALQIVRHSCEWTPTERVSDSQTNAKSAARFSAASAHRGQTDVFQVNVLHIPRSKRVSRARHQNTPPSHGRCRVSLHHTVGRGCFGRGRGGARVLVTLGSERGYRGPEVVCRSARLASRARGCSVSQSALQRPPSETAARPPMRALATTSLAFTESYVARHHRPRSRIICRHQRPRSRLWRHVVCLGRRLSEKCMIRGYMHTGNF
jgi:hypothetical protein